MMPVVDEDPTAPSALPTPDSYEFFTAVRGRSWRNEVTLRTLELFQGYEPGEYLKRISPTPVLMVVAPNDRLVAGELAAAAYETAVAPEEARDRPGRALRRLRRARVRDLLGRRPGLVRGAPAGREDRVTL